jgi:hypothetical protein
VHYRTRELLTSGGSKVKLCGAISHNEWIQMQRHELMEGSWQLSFLGAVRSCDYIALAGMKYYYREWWNVTGREKIKIR